MATLADFLPLIPDPEEDGFSVQLTHAAQFALNGAPASEPRPNKGEKYKHQTFAGLYFLLYSDMLLVHEPGTGKSCLSTTVTETLKEFYLKNDKLSYSPPIKRFYVVARGDILTENWKQELVCTCTSNVYFDEDWRRLSPGQQTKKVNQALRDYYTFLTHNDLVNLTTNKSIEELIEQFADTGFIIDEAHNLVVESADFGTKVNTDETKKVYNALWTIFHHVPGVKKILMTATPMRNSSNELAQLLNLINEKQIEGDIENYTEEELWDVMKGKVSYLRKMTRRINVDYMGEPLNQLLNEPNLEADTIVWPCPMTDVQQEVYVDTALREKKNGVYINTRQASNMVFPDDSFGKKGFTTYVVKKKAAETQGGYNYAIKDDLKYYLDEYGDDTDSRIEQLQRLSSKNAEVLKIADENPDAKGIIYSEYKQGSGAIIKLLLFEYILDYEIITNKFLSQFADDNGFCSSDSVDFSLIEKKNRIALLVPEMTKANRKALLNLYNSPKNVNGEYIRWCIYTPIGREGLSFNNVTVIIRDETWTEATGIQAEDRGIRSNSHHELALLLGGEENVTVQVYRLLPVLTDYENLLPPTARETTELIRTGILEERKSSREIKKKDEDEEKDEEEDNEMEIEFEEDVPDEEPESRSRQSISDAEIYNSPAYAYYRAYIRGKNIEKMMNYIKKFDATGFIHRERNLQKDSLYKRYKLYNPTGAEIATELDFSWYRRYPPEYLISQIVEYLSTVFYLDFSIPLQELYFEFSSQPPELIDICLNEIVMRQITFNNRYGNSCFLVFSSTTISVVPQTTSSVIESDYYSAFTYRFKPHQFSELVENHYLEKNRDMLESYLRARNFSIEARLPDLPIVARNYLLERSINIILESNLEKNPERGRTVSNVVVNRHRQETIPEKIYIHYLPRIFKFADLNVIVTTLLTFKQSERTKHSDTSPLRNITPIRVFDVATGNWSYPTKEKYEIYVGRIKAILDARKENILKLDRFQIYGFKFIDDKDRTLWIADPTTFQYEDKRMHKTGRVFRDSVISEKMAVFWRLNIDIGEKPIDMTVDQMADELTTLGIQFGNDVAEMEYKIRWLRWNQETSKKDDTAIVENKLKELNRLIIY